MKYADCRFLVTGGTGSFGLTVTRDLLKLGAGEVVVFSRDEKKQYDMRMALRDSRARFLIGDVRDRESVLSATRAVDCVFHAAALKQVPSCEFHPMEAVKTNVQGTANVIDAAAEHGVKRVICLSTDKAVYPVNAMGISKALMERVAVAKAREMQASGTVVCCTRYGNVMASRGSVIPLFISQLAGGRPLSITDPAMTRFMMTLDNAVELVRFAFEHANPGDIFIQKAPAATIEVLAAALLDILGCPDHPLQVIGTRHGEKLHESLMSREEVAVAQDLGRYFRVPCDMRGSNYDSYFSDGSQEHSMSEEYSSANTAQLDFEGMAALLRGLDCVKDAYRQIKGGEL